MDLTDNAEEAAFRKEVRDFIAAEAPNRGSGLPPRGEGMAQSGGDWFKKLADKGWIAPAWPKEYGGAGLNVMRQFVLNEEMALQRVPRPMHLVIGLGMGGPTIINHGTEEQKKEFLPSIIKDLDIWCQGFSEPESGSDLASIKTKAVRDGDDYVVNGQKIWTSFAHMAKWMILIARTDPDAPKHRGISYFVVDMKSPGIDVRPITDMGGAKFFNEVFFDNVRVPAKNMIGEEHRGWYVATTTLDHERSAIGNTTGLRQQVDAMIQFAKEDATSTLKTNPLIRYQLADRLIETEMARMLSYRVITMQNRGEVPNHEASMLKLYTSELQQRMASTYLHLIGNYGVLDSGSPSAPAGGRFGNGYLSAVSATIAGGTSEIQRGIIATRGLGLPKN
jgi:alkylation response protein AidB-like acyl-CoA dehydrogenase